MTFRPRLIAAVALAAALADSGAPARAAPRPAVTPYARAFALFERDDYRGARIQLMNVLRANPRDRLARLLNVRVALAMGAGVNAEVEIEKARAAGVPADRTHHLLAQALVLQGKAERALVEADPNVIPRQFTAYAARVRGEAYMYMRQPELAGPQFALATAVAPDDVPSLIARARFELLGGRAAAAQALIDRALSLQPRGAVPLLLKGDVVRATRGLAPALPWFTRALARNPDNIEALLERAATYGDLGRERQSRADIERALTFRSDYPPALYLLAVLETRAGHYTEAQSLMTRVKGEMDDYPPALALQGTIALKLGNVEAASDFLSRAVRKTPGDAGTRRLLASAQLSRGAPEDAIEALKPLADGPAPDAATLTAMGQAYSRAGDLKAAQVYYQRALKAAPRSVSLRSQLAMTQAAGGDTGGALTTLGGALAGPNASQGLATLALVDLRAGNYREALDAANRLVALKPALPVGYNLRGDAWLGLGDGRRAEAEFNAALKRDPKYTEARRNLARALIVMGRPAEARSELLRTLATDPRDARAMLLLAMVASEPSERVQWATQASHADPGALAPRLMLAQAYADSGEPDRAITAARATERDFPPSPEITRMVATISMAAHDYAGAEDAYGRLAELVPGDVGVRMAIARAQSAQGHVEAARRTYAAALASGGTAAAPVYAEAMELELADGRPAAAAALLARMRAALPGSNLPDLAVGDQMTQRGQTARAAASYEAARRIAFDRPTATRLAAAYRALGQPARAMAVLGAFLTAHPADPVGTAAVGEVQMAAGRYRAAAATYEGLLRRGFADPLSVLNNLAWSYHRIGDKRALPTAERAYARAPGAPSVQDTLGTILVDSRADKARGMKLIEAAVRASPRDPEMRYHLAVARVVNGTPALALRELDTALKSARFPGRAGALALQSKLMAH